MEVKDTVKVKQFIKLPNSLVWDSKGKRENTYSHEYTNKLCHIWSMFDCLMNRVGTISFSLEMLVTESGVVANPRSGRNVEQYRSILLGLEEKQFITNTRCNIKTVKYKELILCEYSIPMAVDKDFKDTQFFTVYREDYLKLLQHKTDTKLNKITLLYVYYYLLSRMSNGKSGITTYCFPKYEDITKDLDISENTFTSYLKELKILDLIHYGNIGVIIKNGEKKTANNVYCRHVSHLQSALDISKNYWTAEGWMITNKQVSKINGEIKGFKGQIKKQLNAGKDTTKLKAKLSKLEEKVNNKVDKSLNDIKREIKALNEKLNKTDYDNKLETIVREEWEDYFGDLDKDLYDIDDCADVLEYMQNIEKEQLKEIEDSDMTKTSVNYWGEPSVFDLDKLREEITELAEKLINDEKVSKSEIRDEVIKGRDIKSEDPNELKSLKNDFMIHLDKYKNLPY